MLFSLAGIRLIPITRRNNAIYSTTTVLIPRIIPLIFFFSFLSKKEKKNYWHVKIEVNWVVSCSGVM